MRRLPPLLFFLLCAAAVSRGADNPDFVKTGTRESNGGGQAASGRNEAGQTDGVPEEDHGGDQSDGARNDGGRSRGDAGRDERRRGRRGTDDAKKDPDRFEAGTDDDVPPAPIDIEGARINFSTVVEGYVAKNSPKGYWAYVQKKGGKAAKAWRLALPTVADESIKNKTGAVYAGLVTLRDARDDRALTLEFLVDFSGAKWKVVAVKPAPAPRQ